MVHAYHYGQVQHIEVIMVTTRTTQRQWSNYSNNKWAAAIQYII